MILAPPDGAPFDRLFVKAHLAAAGGTLIALPATGTMPSRYRVAWPEIVRSVEDLAEKIEGDDGRPATPTAQAISEMDAAIAWVALLGNATQTRRLVWLRLMVNPLTDRYIWSWRKLEDRIGLNKDTLMRRHANGLDRIVTRLNHPDWRWSPADDLP
jgi:hypothetical protein